MDSRGHVGFALAATSLALLALSCYYPIQLLALLALLAALAAPLPDIDQSLGFLKHRGLTHTVPFALFLPAAVVAPLCVVGLSICIPLYVMLAVSLLSHIASDAMTVMGVKPFKPFSSRKVALRLFRSNDRMANQVALAVGVASLFAALATSLTPNACSYQLPAAVLLALLIGAPMVLGLKRR